jgi:hypothetical protein
MLITQWTGTPGEKKLYLDLRKKTNPFSSASATPRAIGAM